MPYNENSEFPQVLYSDPNLTGAVPVVLSTTGIKISAFWAKGGPGGVLRSAPSIARGASTLPMDSKFTRQ
jgi:hypothetical protein